MNKLLPRIVASVALLTLFSGCAGYQLGAVKPSAYSGIDKIFVPPFKNETLEPRISSLVTNAVLKQIQADGTYQVSRRSSADAILRGTIVRIRKYQLRGVRTNTIESRELGLYLYINWHLEDPVTGQKIVTLEDTAAPEEVQYDGETINVSNGVVIGDTIQLVDDSFQVGERNSIAIAAEDAARKLVSQLSEGW